MSNGDNPVSNGTLSFVLAFFSVLSGEQALRFVALTSPEALLSTAKAHAENRRLERELKNLRALASRQRGEALGAQKNWGMRKGGKVERWKGVV